MDRSQIDLIAQGNNFYFLTEKCLAKGGGLRAVT